MIRFVAACKGFNSFYTVFTSEDSTAREFLFGAMLQGGNFFYLGRLLRYMTGFPIYNRIYNPWILCFI